MTCLKQLGSILLTDEKKNKYEVVMEKRFK